MNITNLLSAVAPVAALTTFALFGSSCSEVRESLCVPFDWDTPAVTRRVAR